MVRLLVCLLAIVTGLGAAPALAQDPWSPATVVTAQSHDALAVTVDNLGRATAVVTTSREPYELFAVRRAVDGTWGTPVRLGRWAYHSEPVALSDRNGRVTVIWTNRDGTTQRIGAATYVPRVGWSVRMISPADVAAGSPVAAMNSAGRTLVAWTAYSPDGSRRYVQSAIDTGGGEWRADRTHAEGPDVSAQDVAVDADGAMALAAWSGDTASFQRRSAGGTWSSWYRQADSAAKARLAINDGAVTWLFWRVTGKDHDGEPLHAPFVRLRRADGSWTAAVRLADRADELELAVDPQGRATVVYNTATAGGGISVRHRRSDASWSAPSAAVAAAVSHRTVMDLQVDPRGVLHLPVRMNGHNFWSYVRKVPGKPWQAPVALDDAYMEDGFLGVSTDGHVAALWDAHVVDVLGRVRAP